MVNFIMDSMYFLQVYCHGKNDYGQLGVGNPGEECKDPVLVQSLKGRSIVDWSIQKEVWNLRFQDRI